ncbi:MAG: putative ATPase [Ignavibacteria bacterium]|nr:putative ATPase [Ignavibacteria bacterium]
MMISRIKLTNWKNFQNVDFQLKSRAFIVGANASGKSNLIDVIRFLRDVVKQSGGLQHAVDVRGGISKIRCLSARKVSNISIEIDLADSIDEKLLWNYKLSFKHTGGGIFKNEATIVEESVCDLSEKSKKQILNRTDTDSSEDNETKKFTHLEQINSNTKFREIYNFFKEIQYLHIIPQLIRESNSYMLTVDKEDYYGRNLIEKMSKTPEKIKTSYFRKINEFLKIAVPQLKELNLINDDMGIPHLQAVYEHWRAKGAKQQETQFSDGTLRLIGFMWALLDGNETILLEEPELYLNTEIIKQIPGMISRFQRKKNKTRQVIITTHSYDLLDNNSMEPDEIIILKPDSEGTQIKSALNYPEILNYLDSGFTIAESVIPKVTPENITRLLEISL